MRVHHLRFAAGLSLALLVAACATNPATAPTPSRAATGYHLLATGLTAAQVRELLGPPDRTKPFSAAGIVGEIWSYPMRTTTEVKQVAVSLQDVPAINPITGQSMVRKEPVYQNQTIEHTDTLHLLIIDGRLAEWTTVRTEEHPFQ